MSNRRRSIPLLPSKDRPLTPDFITDAVVASATPSEVKSALSLLINHQEGRIRAQQKMLADKDQFITKLEAENKATRTMLRFLKFGPLKPNALPITAKGNS